MKQIKHRNRVCVSIIVITVVICSILLVGHNAYAAEDTTWQEDYFYQLNDVEHTISLEKYNGNAAELTVPAKAIVEDVEYTTYIESNYSKELWSNDKNLKGLNFESGIRTENSLEGLFKDCSQLVSLDLSNLNTSNVTNMRSMFENCRKLTSIKLDNFDTSNVTNMRSMFAYCRKLTSLDLENFKTLTVTDMGEMFSGCSDLTSLDLSNFRTPNVTDMEDMFSGCSNLTSLDLNGFETTNVTNMYTMFSHCDKLTSLDLSKFDISNVRSVFGMFSGCSSLVKLDVSNFRHSKIISTSGMFENCSSLKTVDLSNLDTSNITEMDNMFAGCSKLTSLDLSNFDTSNVRSMGYMFSGCVRLTTLDLSSFDMSSVTNMEYFLYNCSLLKTIKTPCNVSVEEPLPATFHDENMNKYKRLPKNSPVSILLTRDSNVPIPGILKKDIRIVSENGKTLIKPGESIGLFLKGAEGYEVTWKVDNSNVAIITPNEDKATLTMKKTGMGKTVIVSAILKNSKTTIIVRKKFFSSPKGKVIKVKIGGKENTIKKGRSLNLWATVVYKNNDSGTESNDVIWSCNGKGEIQPYQCYIGEKCSVIGKKKGKLKVTAKSRQKPSKSKTITIRVK